MTLWLLLPLNWTCLVCVRACVCLDCLQTWHSYPCGLLFLSLYIALVYVKPTWRGMRPIHILPLRSLSCRSLGCQIVALNTTLVKTFTWFHYKPSCTSRLRPTPNMYFSHLIWHFAFAQHKENRSLMTPLRARVINIDLRRKEKGRREKKKRRRRRRAQRGRRERC